ncbi:STP1 protein [Plasmodium brasilianum]|uniref:STP1 protein n=2 Tax=Plasmodium (Plasmodium) TaxID=418103 RepID=A0A1D3JKG6_PLAMA|nr:STP1 protein [Plasmodium malariae]KAI4841339.1 STP1 protein [Plasmodium brasilianum]SBT87032.1 STP1 protein [Plasmodium malariae]
MDLTGLGMGSVYYLKEAKFKKILKEAKTRTDTLKQVKNKNEFRNNCLNLADYIIKEKTAPQHFSQNNWERALINWLKPKYEGLKKYGGCPVILKDNDKELLKLKYDADDFYEQKIRTERKLKAFGKNQEDSYICNNDAKCKSTCKEYNEWIKNREEYFKEKKSFIERNSKINNANISFRNPINDLLNPETFNIFPKCSILEPPENGQLQPEEHAKGSEKVQTVSESPSEFQDQSDKVVEILRKVETEVEPVSTGEEQSQYQTTPLSEPSSMEITTNQPKDLQSVSDEKSQILEGPETGDLSLQGDTAPSPKVQVSGKAEDSRAAFGNSSQLITNSPFVDSSELPEIEVGLHKKKKKIKRKQVKFLKIRVPSYFDRKSEFSSHDHLEHQIYDDKEIIKKIKIHESDVIKNTEELKRKKEGSKTIIEVHMEVLKKIRNDEWEFNKDEFLDICLEHFKKEEYKTYHNLTDDELMENVQNRNDIEKQKILWNKWLEEHRNISDKLTREEWFNNLKNEWKKELFIKKSEELNSNLLDEIYKIPYLEREKDLWKQWISKNRYIIEQYLEKDWFKGKDEKLQNISDIIEALGNNYGLSLINIEELDIKECYEDLYKYLKRKILEKLCIFVFIKILEECKKEENIENNELYLDSSINKWKIEGNSYEKSQILKNLIETNSSASESSKSMEIHNYIWEDCLRKDLENWIIEDDTYVNFTYNEAMKINLIK